LGSHLVTLRRGYLHHGIYIGERTVFHYSGLAHGLRRGPVEKVPFALFARGRRVWVRLDALSDFDVREVIFDRAAVRNYFGKLTMLLIGQISGTK
jgi:hypothetical protein